ncbi:UNVERIFIED_CONTAM: hypothetical protein FKN15_049907 [Acipenser sinensis]
MAGVSGCMKYSMFFFNFLFWTVQADIHAVNLMIAIGAIIMGLGFFGCCGAIRESRCLLLLPGGDTLNYAKDVAIAIGGVTMAITFCGAYGAKKENKCMLGLGFEMTETVFRNHIPLDEKGGALLDSLSWDSLQKGGECCGLVNGYADWGSEIPDSCNCVAFSSSDCVEVQEKRSQLTNYDLPRMVYKQPCMYVVFEILESGLKIVLGFTLGFAVIALIGMILSMTLCCQVRKKSIQRRIIHTLTTGIMQGRLGFMVVVGVLLRLKIAGCFSGDQDDFLTIHQRRSERPLVFYPPAEEGIEKSVELDGLGVQRNLFHSLSHARISKLRPAMIVKSTFPQASHDQSISLGFTAAT